MAPGLQHAILQTPMCCFWPLLTRHSSRPQPLPLTRAVTLRAGNGQPLTGFHEQILWKGRLLEMCAGGVELMEDGAAAGAPAEGLFHWR